MSFVKASPGKLLCLWRALLVHSFQLLPRFGFLYTYFNNFLVSFSYLAESWAWHLWSKFLILIGLILRLAIPLHAYSPILLQLTLMFPCLLFPPSLQMELVCPDAFFPFKTRRHPESHIPYILPVPAALCISGISFHRLPLLHSWSCLPFPFATLVNCIILKLVLLWVKPEHVISWVLWI